MTTLIGVSLGTCHWGRVSLGTYNFDTHYHLDYPDAEVINMARHARQLSACGIYHVMLRGINHTQLFYDDDDRFAFLERLARFKGEDSFKLYAYALVGNHTHLLIEENTDRLALIVKRLTVSYSHWFNAKYQRSGYLFEGRFKSEPVDDDAYLLTVFKYIHQNPVKIGESIDSWTSYSDYMKTPVLIDDEFMLKMFAKDKDRAREQIGLFLDVPLAEDADVLGTIKPKNLADAEAVERIKRVSGLSSCNRLAELDREERDRVLSQLKEEGFTIRQISRLTGINRGIVQKAKRADS